MRIAAGLGHVDACCKLCDILYTNGDLVGAVAACHRALEIDPSYFHAMLSLGQVLRKKGDQAGAEATYRRALQIDPNDTETLFGLGIV